MYTMVDNDRLSHDQCVRLLDILDYLQVPRPELEWGGKKRESRKLTDAQWKAKLARELYTLYRDMYPRDVITRDHIEDFFDDNYVESIMSTRTRLKKFLCKVFGCYRTPKPDKL